MNRTALEVAHTPPGQYIYAYCNVRTNQVLYSLDRTLSPSHLKQLPDLGANYTPPSLRKDSWRPFWSLSLPSTPYGRSQGLHAFKKLREWRKLHETCWEPSAQLSRPYTEKEIENLKAKLDERGGSKKESVYDVIKRQKHKMKVHAVMDQKANSVADLAAVLLEQDRLGSESLDAREKRDQEARRKMVQDMLRLAEEAENGGVETLTKEIEVLKDTLAQTAEGHRRKVRKRLRALGLKQQKMQFAFKNVADARLLADGAGPDNKASGKAESASGSTKDGMTPADKRARIQELRMQLQKMVDAKEQRSDVVAPMSEDLKEETAQAQNGKIHALQNELAILEGEEDDFVKYLEPWPQSLDPLQMPTSSLPKRRRIREQLKLRNTPIFTTEGVTVRWADILDAEFAALWPEHVAHERMSRTKASQYTHPDVEQKQKTVAQKERGPRHQLLAQIRDEILEKISKEGHGQNINRQIGRARRSAAKAKASLDSLRADADAPQKATSL